MANELACTSAVSGGFSGISWAHSSLGATTGVTQRPFKNAEMRTLLLCGARTSKITESKVKSAVGEV